jgi:hypothetical protein
LFPILNLYAGWLGSAYLGRGFLGIIEKPYSVSCHNYWPSTIGRDKLYPRLLSFM